MAILLTWTDNNYGEDAYVVYRDTSPIDTMSPPAPLISLPAGSESYEDSSVVEGTVYYYRVATDFNGTLYWSDEQMIEAQTLGVVQAKYWRVYIQATQGSAFAGIAEIEFRGEIGGDDLAVGGTPYSSTNYAGNGPELAFDGNPATSWASSGAAMPQWVGYEFLSPVAIAETMIKARPEAAAGVPLQALMDYQIEYSDDNVVWNVLGDPVVSDPAWGLGEERTVFGQLFDQYYEYTVAVLGFEGPDASTVFTNESPVAIDPVAAGNAQLDTSQFKFGSSSLILDGSSDYTDFPPNDFFAFGDLDFTLEWFQYLNTTANTGIIDFRGNVSSAPRPTVYISSNTLRYFLNSTNAIISTEPMVTGVWQHIAVSRINGLVELFIDGVSGGTYNDSAITYTQDGIRVGQTSYPFGASVNGWIDELTFTKGIGRYSGGFTPPTASRPRIGPYIYATDWRIYITDNETPTGYASVAELEMRGEVGGPDQCTGGTAFASSTIGGGSPADAFDDNTGTFWASGNGLKIPSFLGYTFTEPVTVKEIAMTARSGSANDVSQTPIEFYVEFSTDGGVTWNAYKFFTGLTSWTALETKLFEL